MDIKDFRCTCIYVDCRSNKYFLLYLCKIQEPSNNLEYIETPSINRNRNLQKAELSKLPGFLILCNIFSFLYRIYGNEFECGLKHVISKV